MIFYNDEYNKLIEDICEQHPKSFQYFLKNEKNKYLHEYIISCTQNHLNDEKPCMLINKLNEAINYTLPKPVLQEKTVLLNISKALLKYQIKTRSVSLPQHLIVEYNNKYFGIMLYENPGNTEFTMINEYRECKSSDFPTIIVWLPDFVEDFNAAIQKIVEGIKSW